MKQLKVTIDEINDYQIHNDTDGMSTTQIANIIRQQKSPDRILAKLIQHMDGWAYDIFNENDYSDDWYHLKKWAKDVLEEE